MITPEIAKALKAEYRLKAQMLGLDYEDLGCNTLRVATPMYRTAFIVRKDHCYARIEGNNIVNTYLGYHAEVFIAFLEIIGDNRDKQAK